jgi:hypothetical protein
MPLRPLILLGAMLAAPLLPGCAPDATPEDRPAVEAPRRAPAPRAAARPARPAAPETPPEPAAFPLRDVDAACAAFAGSDRVRQNACLEREQSGYNIARGFWEELEAARQRACLATAERGAASGYYTRLGPCVARAIRAQRLAGEPARFRY